MIPTIPLNSRWMRPQQGPGIYWEVTSNGVLFVEPSANKRFISDIYRDAADIEAAVKRGELVAWEERKP